MDVPNANQPSPRRHLANSLVTRLFWLSSLVAAVGLVVVSIGRLAVNAQLLAWHAILARVCFADFCSGLVHWFADTWGRESMPVIGKRLLHPFRVHHTNPADILRRSVIDLNGDVAILAFPVLIIGLLIPIESAIRCSLAVFITTAGAIRCCSECSFSGDSNGWCGSSPAACRGKTNGILPPW